MSQHVFKKQVENGHVVIITIDIFEIEGATFRRHRLVPTLDTRYNTNIMNAHRLDTAEYQLAFTHYFTLKVFGSRHIAIEPESAPTGLYLQILGSPENIRK